MINDHGDATALINSKAFFQDNDLINDSYNKYRNNHIVRLIYFGNCGNNPGFCIKYEKERKVVSNHINEYFTENTEIERYFIEMWSKKKNT